jgi:hypothetical protein
LPHPIVDKRTYAGTVLVGWCEGKDSARFRKGSANGPGLTLRKARSDLGYSTGAVRTSENSVKAKFAELSF